MSTASALKPTLTRLEQRKSVSNMNDNSINRVNSNSLPFFGGMKNSTTEINVATKSLYLGVATSRAFPYVDKWLRDKTAEMQKKTTILQNDCNKKLLNETHSKHKALSVDRIENAKKREKMLVIMQELQSAKEYQCKLRDRWLHVLREATSEYMSSIHEMGNELLNRIRLVEDWTLRGERDSVMSTLKYFEKQLCAFEVRVKRDIEKETIRRDQTLRNVRGAMEKIIGQVSDAVTWEMHQRLHRQVLTKMENQSSLARDNKNISFDMGSITTDSDISLFARESELEILAEEREIKNKLRLLKRRNLRRAQRRASSCYNSNSNENGCYENNDNNKEQTKEKLKQNKRNVTAKSPVKTRTTPETVNKEGKNTVDLYNKDNHTAINPNFVQNISTGKSNNNVVFGPRDHIFGSPHHSISLFTRPPIVQPPNYPAVGNSHYDSSKCGFGPANNPEHIAGLLAVLSEDTAHFADSREKTHAEVKKLREELKKHQAETARLLQLNVELEAQRAQLIVQRDAQMSKLNAGLVKKKTIEQAKDVDNFFFYNELSHTLELLQEQQKNRMAEVENVKRMITDLSSKVKSYELLLQHVKNYWRTNLTAIKEQQEKERNEENKVDNAQYYDYEKQEYGEMKEVDNDVKNIHNGKTPQVFSKPFASVETGVQLAPNCRATYCRTARPLKSQTFLPLIKTRSDEKEKYMKDEQRGGMAVTQLSSSWLSSFESIPALGLYNPCDVAEFIYSIVDVTGDLTENISSHGIES